MTIHVYYEHHCAWCRAQYIPFARDVVCPKCGLLEEIECDFIIRAVKSIRNNLAQTSTPLPNAWTITSFSDWVLDLIFSVLNVARLKPEWSLEQTARKCLETIDWRDHEYLKAHLIALIVQIQMKLEQSLLTV